MGDYEAEHAEWRNNETNAKKFGMGLVHTMSEPCPDCTCPRFMHATGICENRWNPETKTYNPERCGCTRKAFEDKVKPE